MTLPHFARLSEAGGVAFFDPFALQRVSISIFAIATPRRMVRFSFTGRLGELLLMMEHAMSLLLFGTRFGRECPLASSSSCQAPKTILCSTAPWRIEVAADGMLCAFSGAMATFGAVGKVIDRRDHSEM